MKLQKFAAAKDFTIAIEENKQTNINWVIDEERKIFLESFSTTNSRICYQTESAKIFRIPWGFFVMEEIR